MMHLCSNFDNTQSNEIIRQIMRKIRFMLVRRENRYYKKKFALPKGLPKV